METRGYISLPRTQMLMENTWKKRLDAIAQVVPMSSERRAATAVCLENTRNQIKYLESIGATQSPDIGAYKRFALDISNTVSLVA